MKRLLLPLLAALAFHNTVITETWYLFAFRTRGTNTIPAVSKEACEISGEIFGIKKVKIRKDLNLGHQYL